MSALVLIGVFSMKTSTESITADIGITSKARAIKYDRSSLFELKILTRE